uniref:Mitochondrial inner membrane protease ATP23 n=1 Tax=Rhizophora mucronata TaxID=61149 RepID=A0A2P2K6H0_RHIMU
MEEQPAATPASGSRVSIEQCQDMIRRSFRTPVVKFLKEHLEKAGCWVDENFIKAVHCEEKLSGGYVRGQGVANFCLIIAKSLDFWGLLVSLYSLILLIMFKYV